MKNYNLKAMQKELRREIDPSRYEHTMGVMYTAASLAMCYGVDIEQAMVAGLLHDCAKCIPNSRKIKICQKSGIEISEAEKRNQFLLHAKVGAFLAKTKYGIEDEEILDAIACHTTGRPGMTTLDKIIYIADFIEPGRDKASNLPIVRKLAYEDLDACLYRILKDTLSYLKQGSGEIDDMTRLSYNYYHDRLEDE